MPKKKRKKIKKRKFRKKARKKKVKKNIFKKKNKKIPKKTRKRKIRKNKKRKNKVKKKFRSPKKTRVVILSLLKANEKLKSVFRFNFNLDRSLQNFFQGISDKMSEIKKVIQEEREKQKRIKIQEMEREKKEIQNKLKNERDNELKVKEQELKDEIKLGKERKQELQKFIKLEQAEVRREQAEKQRKFLEQIKLEKKIEKFRKREAVEIIKLERFVLGQQRESYADVQDRIDKIKQKYQALRDQKIRERVEQLGVKVEEGDDRAALLEKERVYNLERQKIEFALESYARSAQSLVFQLNKRWLPKYLNILRLIDRRFETSEIFINGMMRRMKNFCF